MNSYFVFGEGNGEKKMMFVFPIMAVNAESSLFLFVVSENVAN